MVRWGRRPEWERLGLGASLAVGAMAWGCGIGGALAFLAVLVVPALVVQWLPGPRVVAVLTRTGVLLPLVTVALGGLWVIYPVIGESTILAVTRLLGVLLVSGGVLGVTSWPLVSARRGVVPQSLALLGLGLFEPLASQRLALVLGVALGVGVVALERQRSPAASRSVAGWLSFVGAVAASVALAIGIAQVLPWAQPHVEQAVARAFSGAEASTGVNFSDQARIGEYAKLGISRRVALRVWAREPRLLRARVLNRFDGRVWSRGASPRMVIGRLSSPMPTGVGDVFDTLPGETLALLGRAGEGGVPGPAPGSGARVVLAQSTNGGLFVPAGVAALRLAGDGATLDEAGVVRAVGLWAGDVYGYAVSRADARQGVPTADDLALPSDLDPRVGELAHRLGAGVAPPEQYLRSVLVHLAGDCVYSLDVGQFKTRQPVAEFLFDKKRGYCEYFASAAAVLLRRGGVPARFVSGLSVRHSNAIGDHFVVRESDAHAWIDAFLPGRGWVEADPTPAAQFAAVHDDDRPGRLAEWLEAIRSTWSEFTARVRSQGIGVLGWVLRGALGHPIRTGILALGGWGLARAWRWLRGRKRNSRERGRIRQGGGEGVPRDLHDLVVRVELGWEGEGAPRPASRALLDHLALLAERQGTTKRREVERQLIDAYYRARFGGVVPEAGAVADLAARWLASSAGSRRSARSAASPA